MNILMICFSFLRFLKVDKYILLVSKSKEPPTLIWVPKCQYGNFKILYIFLGLLRGCDGKESTCQCRVNYQNDYYFLLPFLIAISSEVLLNLIYSLKEYILIYFLLYNSLFELKHLITKIISSYSGISQIF